MKKFVKSVVKVVPQPYILINGDSNVSYRVYLNEDRVMVLAYYGDEVRDHLADWEDGYDEIVAAARNMMHFNKGVDDEEV